MELTGVDRIEEFIAGFISKELGIPQAEVDYDLNFGAFGLSSMSGMKLVGRLEEDLKTKVKPIMLFDNPTIARLAKAIVAGGPDHSPFDSNAD